MAGYRGWSGSLLTMTMAEWMLVVMMLMASISHEFFMSAQNEDADSSFRYFNRIIDPSMNIYQVDHPNPLFHKIFFNPTNNMLLLAGLDSLYQLNPQNISLELERWNLTSHPDFKANDLLSACETQTKKRSEGMCKNVVQMVYWRSSEKVLWICTSAFGSPREFVVDPSRTGLINMSATKDATGKCSGIPFSSFTSVYVEKARAIFSGLPFEDYQWHFGKYVVGGGMEILNEILSLPHATEVRYVASVDVDEFVYVFLAEVPQEELFFGAEKIFYTRIGRICKNEPGNVLDPRRVTSYVKARVFCKGSSKDEMFYHVVNDVFYDEAADKFHLLSSTLQGDASAVCLVERRSVDEIVAESALLGLDGASCWTEITANLPNKPRPSTCVYGINTLVGQLMYNLEHDLASTSLDISSDTNINVFYTKFLVQPLESQNFIYWMYSPNDVGYLTKIFMWYHQGIPTLRRIARIKLFKRKNQISELHDLKMVNSSGKFFIYAVMEKSVVQLNPEMCSGHKKCTSCAVDPHCAWLVSARKCISLAEAKSQSAENYLSKPGVGSPLKLCLSSCVPDGNSKIFAISGSNVVIACDSFCAPDEGSHPVWYHDGRPLFPTSDDDGEDEEYAVEKNARLVGSRDFRLYFLNSTYNFSGKYECRDAASGGVIAGTSVDIARYCTLEGGFEATWRREFNKWCKSYEEYAASFQVWKSQQCSDTNCIKNCCHK